MQIRFTDRDRPGFPEPADNLGIFAGDAVIENLAGCRRAGACSINVVLQRDRNTV